MQLTSDFSFSDIVANANDAVVVTSADSLDEPGPTIIYVNDAYTRLSGYRPDEVIGRSPRFLQGEGTDRETCKVIREALEAGRPVRARLLNYGKDARQYWVDMNIMPLYDKSGKITHFAAIQRDVTGDVKREEDLMALATTDDLTGSKNRRHFMERAELEVHRLRRHGVPFSLALLDLDHFKNINDTYGHPAGDDVLREAVKRWQFGRRPFDTLGRLGGEEFALLLPGADGDAAMTVAERLRAVIADTPFQTVAGTVKVSVSIGVAEAEADDRSIDGTLGRADEALYQSKKAGRNRCTKASPIPVATRNASGGV